MSTASSTAPNNPNGSSSSSSSKANAYKKADQLNTILADFYGADPEEAVRFGGVKHIRQVKFSEGDTGYLQETGIKWTVPKKQQKIFAWKLMTADGKKASLMQSPLLMFRSMQQAFGLGNWIPQGQRDPGKYSPEYLKHLPDKEQDSKMSLTPSLHAPFESMMVKSENAYNGLNKYAIEFTEFILKMMCDCVKRQLIESPKKFKWAKKWIKKFKLENKEVAGFDWKEAMARMPWKDFVLRIAPHCNLGFEKDKHSGDDAEEAAGESDKDPKKKKKNDKDEDEDEEEDEEDEDLTDMSGVACFEDLVVKMVFYVKQNCFFPLLTKEDREKYTPYPVEKYALLEGYNGPESLKGERKGITHRYTPFDVSAVVGDYKSGYGMYDLSAEQRCNPKFFPDNVVCRVAFAITVTPDNNKGKTKVSFNINRLLMVCFPEIPLAQHKMTLQTSGSAMDEFSRKIAERAAEKERKDKEEKQRQMEEDAKIKAMEMVQAAEEAKQAEDAKRKLIEREKEAAAAAFGGGGRDGVVEEDPEPEADPGKPVKFGKFVIPSVADDDD